MFERYTEKARRVIFFARYEASQFGNPYIETEHLLLGLLREDKALTNRFLRSHASIESIRRQIEATAGTREKVSTSVDMPLSHDCKRVLVFAAEEAALLSHNHIGTEHLLLGLLREESGLAAMLLRDNGFERDQVLAIAEKGVQQPVDPWRVFWDAKDHLIPPSADLMDLLKLAVEEAEEFKEGYMKPDPVLLALLRGKDCAAKELLTELGLDLEKARTEIKRRRENRSGDAEVD